MKSAIFLVLLVSIIIFSHVSVFAEEFSVKTSKEVYSYGDYLSFTVTVPRVTNEIATFKIIDDEKNAGSLVQMAITNETSTLTAPNPFESFVYKEGTYTIEINYEDQITTTEFILIDSGITTIPFWIKDVASLWIDQVIDDKGFLKNLIDNKIVTTENPIKKSTTVNIPTWYKTNAIWWKNGMISNDEFTKGLQYLISANVITLEEKMRYG